MGKGAVRGGAGGGGRGVVEEGRERQRAPPPVLSPVSSRFICVSALSDPTISEPGTDYAGVQFCGWAVFFLYFTVTIFCDCSSLSFRTGTLIDFRYCKQLRTRFFRL